MALAYWYPAGAQGVAFCGPGEDCVVADVQSPGEGVDLTLDVGTMPGALDTSGSAVLLFIEGEYGVASLRSEGAYSAYFIRTDRSGGVPGVSSGRVDVETEIEIDVDDYMEDVAGPAEGVDEYRVRVPLPDFCSTDDPSCVGFNGVAAGDGLRLVVERGISNPEEGGSFRWRYALENAAGDRVGATYYEINDLRVIPDLVLGRVKGIRGVDVVASGRGFADGLNAQVFVMPHALDRWWSSLSCGEEADSEGSERKRIAELAAGYPGLGLDASAYPPDCIDPELPVNTKLWEEARYGLYQQEICQYAVRGGSPVGSGNVARNHVATVAFSARAPVFSPGRVNYLCMVDGAGNRSGQHKIFDLEPSGELRPETASPGDQVSMFVVDLPLVGAELCEMRLGGRVVYRRDGDPLVDVEVTPVGGDGSATLFFDLPGEVGGLALVGDIRLATYWCDDGVAVGSVEGILHAGASVLTVGRQIVLPNQIVTLQGENFGSNAAVFAPKVTLDGAPLLVMEDSFTAGGAIEVSNSGSFVFRTALWIAGAADTALNPALIPGPHTIRVEDESGFSGTVQITVPEPSITITPDKAAPWDFVTIQGNNWPVDNVDGGNVSNVDLIVDDRPGRAPRGYTLAPNTFGRWEQRHKVSQSVDIPSVNEVRASYDGLLVRLGRFAVVGPEVTVTPSMAKPGEYLTVTLSGMPIWERVDSVSLGGRPVASPVNPSTDGAGFVEIGSLLVPALDPGEYPVLIRVGAAVAIGSVEVEDDTLLGPEDGAIEVGVSMPLPGALERLGDRLVRVWWFDNATKGWEFYDPRPAFRSVNTLADMVTDQVYWVLVSETVEAVSLNRRSRTLACVSGNCWSYLKW